MTLPSDFKFGLAPNLRLPDCRGNCGAAFTEKMLRGAPLILHQTGYRARPFWSVMIPTYNARADYLEETLNSVLQQDPGPGQMKIEVVDSRRKRTIR